jgi:hypothetical protein
MDRRYAFLMLIFLVAGCKDETPLEGGSPSTVVFPSQEVSYAQHVQPLFNQACALAGCHDNGTHQSELRLTTYFNTVFATQGVVIPGQPESSTLIFRIEGTAGQPMPLNSPPLNQNQINGIRTWIVEGAMDN